MYLTAMEDDLRLGLDTSVAAQDNPLIVFYAELTSAFYLKAGAFLPKQSFFHPFLACSMMTLFSPPECALGGGHLFVGGSSWQIVGRPAASPLTVLGLLRQQFGGL